MKTVYFLRHTPLLYRLKEGEFYPEVMLVNGGWEQRLIPRFTIESEIKAGNHTVVNMNSISEINMLLAAVDEWNDDGITKNQTDKLKNSILQQFCIRKEII